jgi:glycosyltransferase involved in cell wall biosynthesis
MRILNLVAGEKWTGAAAVVFDQTRALVEAGVEAQFGFVRESPLARRLGPLGWARPILTRPRSPLDYVRDLRTLRQTVLRERFELVHAHLSHDHALVVAALGGTGLPVVRTFHHLDQLRRDPLTGLVAGRTRAFAYANSAIARRHGGPGPVHSPVVDRERLRPAERPRELARRLGIEEGRLVIGTVGKLARGRGHEEAITALAALPTDAVLLHVGKGEHRPGLERFAAERGVSDRNFWTGYEEELLAELYRVMDVFLFCASGSQQGQRAILEAMASGLPVVAFDLPGVRDLVTEGEEGFVVENARQAAERLARLRADPALRTRLGRRGRDRTRRFSAESFAQSARLFYAGVLEASSGRRTGAPTPVRKSSTS